MTNENLTTEKWVVGYALDFEDGESEGRVIHRGTLEECERVRNLMPAVSYSGDRKVERAHSFVMRQSDWETLK